jgi:hypothetical protein
VLSRRLSIPWNEFRGWFMTSLGDFIIDESYMRPQTRQWAFLKLRQGRERIARRFNAGNEKSSQTECESCKDDKSVVLSPSGLKGYTPIYVDRGPMAGYIC